MADAAGSTADAPAIPPPLAPPAAAAAAAPMPGPPVSAPAPAAPPKREEDIALVKMHEIVDGFLARPDSGPFREPVDWRGLELDDYPEIVKHPMDLGTVKRKLERHEYGTAAECAYDIKLIWRNCQKYNAEGSEFWILAKSFIRRFEDLFRKVRHEHEVGEMPSSSPSEGDEDDAGMDEDEDSSGGEDEEDDQEEEDDDQPMEDDKEDDDDGDEEDEEEDDDVSKAASGGLDSGSAKRTKRSRKLEPKKLDEKAALAANLLSLDGTSLGKVIAILQKECPTALEYLHGQAEEEQVEIVLDKLEGTETFRKVWDFCAQHAVRRRGADQIEEAMRRMHTDPAELMPADWTDDDPNESKGTRRGRPRTDNRDIQQIDSKTGDVVNVFASLSAAGNAVGFSRHIVASILRKKYKATSYQGWTFKYVGGEPEGYEDDGPNSKSKAKKRKKTKPALRAQLASPRAIAVAELDFATGQVIRVHPSLTKASKVSGANRHVITKVLSGEIPSWQGLQWKYCDAESHIPLDMLPPTSTNSKE